MQTVAHATLRTNGVNPTVAATPTVDESFHRAHSHLSDFANIQRQVIQDTYPTDETVVAPKWSQAFVQGIHSYEIYEAIASTGGGKEDTSGYDRASIYILYAHLWF